MSLLELYADETGYPSSSYQTICMIVGEPYLIHTLSAQLLTTLQASKIAEMKFARTRTNRKYLQLAKKRVGIRCEMLEAGIDTYLAGSNKADDAGLHTLYQHLFRSIKTKHPASRFLFLPDQNNALHRGEQIKDNQFALPLQELREVDSSQEPLIQLCDLLAGLHRFSLKQADEQYEQVDEKSYRYRQQLLEKTVTIGKDHGLPLQIGRHGLQVKTNSSLAIYAA